MYQYTVADGLPSNYVYNVVQDHDGYIWAHTENGIAKFDGYTWQPYTTKDGLPGNDVHSLKVDKKGILWGLTSNKKQFGFKDGEVILPEEEFVSVANFLYKGAVHYRGNTTVVCMDSTGRAERTYSSETEDTAVTVHFDLNTAYSVHTKDTLVIKASKILNGTEEILVEQELMTKTNFIRPITLAGKDYLICLLAKAAMLYAINDDEVISLPYSDSGVLYEQYLLAYTTSEGTLRLESDKGCWVYDHTFQLRQSWTDSNFTTNYDVNGCRYDRDDNLWVSTRSNGVFIVPREKLRTSILTLGKPADNAFEGILKASNGTLFAANDHGTVVMLKDGEVAKAIQTANQKTRYGGMSYDIANNIILTTFRPGMIAVTTDGVRRDIKHIAPYSYLKFRAGQQDRHAELMPHLLKASKQILTKHSNVFIHSHEGTYGASADMPYGKLLFENANTSLRGEYPYYSIANDSLYKVDSNGASASYFSDIYTATDILPLGNGSMLVGTEGSGIILFESQTGIIREVLATKLVKRVKAVGDYILLATYGGSYILDESLQPLHHITTLEGLPSDEVNDVTLQGNKLYSATVSGIGITDLPQQVANASTTADLSVTSYLVDGQFATTLDDLSTKVSTIEIVHPLAHYASLGRVTYKYRLLPLDDTWTASTSLSTILYGLEPNKYNFELQAVDAYGGLHTADTVAFTIPRPYYQQLWYRGLITLLTVGGLLYYYRARDRRRQAAYEKDKDLTTRMADLKLSALRSQMNPHFIFNALGAIQYYIQTHKAEEADRYLTQFAALMRMYLDSSKSTLITVSEEVSLLEHYLELEQMRFEGLFNYEITVADDINKDSMLLPPMMIQPLVENSVNHGIPLRNDGLAMISVRFYKERDTLQITIADNGIGTEKAKMHTRKNHTSRSQSILREKLDTLSKSGLAHISMTDTPTSTDPDYPGLSTTLSITTDR